MPILRALCTFEHDSGLPEDRVTNTWHFLTTSGDQPTIAADLALQLEDFYEGTHVGSANALSAFYSSDFAGPWTVDFYNLADPTPRVPILTVPYSMSPGSNALPNEVALCLSFQAARLSGVNQASRRGRIYCGPFANNSNILTSTGGVNVGTNGLGQTLQAAGLDLLEDSNAAADWSWAVYSPTLNSAAAVDNGWVDDAWDTQRRRGERPVSRLIFQTV